MKSIRSLLALSACFTFALAGLAQVAADTVTTAAATAPADDGSSLTTIISVAVALVSGLIAIWQNKQATTARKVTQSIVLGVEQATKLPQVQAAEKQIKATIRRQAEELGVQPILQRVVKDLT